MYSGVNIIYATVSTISPVQHTPMHLVMYFVCHSIIYSDNSFHSLPCCKFHSLLGGPLLSVFGLSIPGGVAEGWVFGGMAERWWVFVVTLIYTMQWYFFL